MECFLAQSRFNKDTRFDVLLQSSTLRYCKEIANTMLFGVNTPIAGVNLTLVTLKLNSDVENKD
jgi:hypothetical protein